MINKEALALAAKINKAEGEGTIVVASQMKIARRFTTGSVALDIAIGGGWPGNQWVEVVGMESHGKTTIVYKTIAANQAADPDFTTLWIAAEHYDESWAASLGVDNERVLVIPTQGMEFAYQTMLEFAASRSVDCIVLDSYPALIADEEAEKDMDEAVMALGARLTGKFFRKAGAATKRSLTDPADRPILGIIINQYRDKIGGYSPHGTPKTTPGGNAKNFAFYVRVEVRRDDWIKEKRPGMGEVNVGQTIKVKTIKNKSAAPQQVASVDFYFSDATIDGFSFKKGEYDTVKEIVTLGVLYGVIQRRGAYFDVGGNRIQGRDALVQALRESPDLLEQVKQEVLAVAFQRQEPVTDEELNAAATAGKKTVKRSKRGSATEDVAQAGEGRGEVTGRTDDHSVREPVDPEERHED